MTKRTAIQYSRIELTNKLGEYFPRLDQATLREAGMSLRSYCADLQHLTYEGFKGKVTEYIPRASEKKVRSLFDSLFPDSHNEATERTAPVTQTKLLNSISHIGKNHVPKLHRGRDWHD